MHTTRHLLAWSLTGAVLAGCTQFNDFFHPAPKPTPDCVIVSEVPAPLFHVTVTSPASAGATVSLEPWVYLSAPAAWMDEVLPATFRADVNAAAKEIVVSGQIRRRTERVGGGCIAAPLVYQFPTAATLSLPVVLTATGTYTVRIASESFTTQRPPSDVNPSLPPRTYPEAAATRSLVID